MHRITIARCGLLGSLVVCCMLAASPLRVEGVALFESHPFESWKVVGGAASFSLDIATADGPTLLGHGPIARNGFLVSPNSYANFTLEVGVKIGAEMNSGIQIRSRVDANTVKGLQIEIDPSDRKWAGGVYDEGGRGWLASLKDKPEAQAAFKVDAWNQFRIECDGPLVRTWVNGVPCAAWLETTALTGVLAFQVHSGPKCEVRWRNPRMTERGWHQWRAIEVTEVSKSISERTITLSKDAEGFAIDATGAFSVSLCSAAGNVVRCFEADLSACEGECAQAVGELRVVWNGADGRVQCGEKSLAFTIPKDQPITLVHIRNTESTAIKSMSALTRGQW